MTHAYVSTFHFLYGSREKRLNIVKTSWQLGSSPLSHLPLRQRHCQPLPWLCQAASPSSAWPGVTCARNPCQENTSLSRHCCWIPVLCWGKSSLCSTNTSVCPTWAKFGQKQYGVLFKLLGFCSCFYPEPTGLRVKCHSRFKITGLWQSALGHPRRFGAQKEAKNH